MKHTKFFPILLMICPYVLILPILCGHLDLPEEVLLALYNFYPFITALIMLVALIGNILLPWIHKMDALDLAFWDRLIKLVHIPYYVFAFVFGLFVPVAIMFVFFLDALLLIASSGYGIAALYRAKREDTISGKFAWFHGFCHLLFVLDVFSSLFLYRKLEAAQD